MDVLSVCFFSLEAQKRLYTAQSEIDKFAAKHEFMIRILSPLLGLSYEEALDVVVYNILFWIHTMEGKIIIAVFPQLEASSRINASFLSRLKK